MFPVEGKGQTKVLNLLWQYLLSGTWEAVNTEMTHVSEAYEDVLKKQNIIVLFSHYGVWFTRSTGLSFIFYTH